MKFDLWTFFFQIVNFVVLLFILKRLLFKPIREIMEKRRKAISDALDEADAKKHEAEKLSGEFKEELRAQKKLRQEAEAAMRAEVDEERKRLMEAARRDAEKLMEKEWAVFETEKSKFEDSLRAKAVEAVSSYAENILRDISGEDLQRSIVRRFRQEVDGIARDMSGINHPGKAVPLKVLTAYPLGTDEVESLKEALRESLQKNITFTFETDPELIAGISVRADDRVYDFSLRGQIRDLGARLGSGG